MREKGAVSFACSFNGFLENIACFIAVGKIFVGDGEKQQPISLKRVSAQILDCVCVWWDYKRICPGT